MALILTDNNIRAGSPLFPPVGVSQKSLRSHIRVVEETEWADKDGHKLLSTWVWLPSDSLLMYSVYRPEGKWRQHITSDKPQGAPWKWAVLFIWGELSGRGGSGLWSLSLWLNAQDKTLRHLTITYQEQATPINESETGCNVALHSDTKGSVFFGGGCQSSSCVCIWICSRLGEIIGRAGRGLFRRGALFRFFPFLLLLSLFHFSPFFFFSTLWVLKQKPTTFPTAQGFPSGAIAGATAAERAASFLLSSEPQLPAAQGKTWLYVFISTIKETWKQIETVPVDCQPALNFHGDFTLVADRMAQWKWCL